ncbi:hypothetical protein P168DRAFT_297039 [Aspergillus campestris IBT 28561]|uniref:Rhodopsin domain-containing protein n=1 Tax=Aspergillus campestris (strain IBT 28561) TaxID=1392248 RepID=A0A2I1D2N6_ASPC2|nr:uncharacterized protein P168DRAFT_297039 [Aspergillus campestris IBT 28561]PKY04108.1 hypothetical protein P168DRAFT_297039 [Aspergillus campestris IBT 28561]
MELPPPPPGLDIYEDRSGKVIASVLAPAILAVIAVGLRVWARYISKAEFRWDDYLIILALVVAKLGGMGKHIWHPDINMEVMYQLVFAMEFIYSCTIPAIKMSVIMFYHRIFAISHFRYILYMCSFLAIGWFVGVMVVNLVQCKPTQYLWKQFAEPPGKGECIDVQAYFMGNGIAEAVTDFIILGAPFYEVYKLQMPTPQKLAVMCIFGLGAFTCVAGALRCYAVKIMNESEDVPWNFGRGFIWSSIEPSLGIVSACLPTLRPIVRYLFPSGFGSSKKTSDFYRLQEGGTFVSGTGNVALTNDIRRGNRDSSPDPGLHDDPDHFITVQREFMWSSKSATNNSTP